MNRSHRPALALTLLVLAGSIGLAGTAAAQSADAPPSRPGNFRASLYAGTGGELFWQRSTDDRGVRDYAFEVIAIDRQGRRSAASRTTVRTDGGTPNPPQATGPAAPRDVRLQMYSGTAAELFWTRAPAADPVARTEVKREGTLAAPIASCVDPAAGFPILSYPLGTDFTSGNCVGDDTAPRRTLLAPLGFPARAVRYADTPACRDGLVERGSTDACAIDVVVFKSASGYWTSLLPVADPDNEFSLNIRATRDEAAFFQRFGPPPNQPGNPPPIDPSSVAGCTARFSANGGVTALRPTDDSTGSRCNAVLDALIVDLGGL